MLLAAFLLGGWGGASHSLFTGGWGGVREASHMSHSLFTRMSRGGGSGVEGAASVVNLAFYDEGTYRLSRGHSPPPSPLLWPMRALIFPYILETRFTGFCKFGVAFVTSFI